MVFRRNISNDGVNNESTVGEVEDDLADCWDEEDRVRRLQTIPNTNELMLQLSASFTLGRPCGGNKDQEVLRKFR